MGWQPIETAPRDGTSIIVATNTGFVGEAFFHHEWCWQRRGRTTTRPTHWMPLPPPPVKTGD